jgi:hypothetical protein
MNIPHFFEYGTHRLQAVSNSRSGVKNEAKWKSSSYFPKWNIKDTKIQYIKSC